MPKMKKSLYAEAVSAVQNYADRTVFPPLGDEDYVDACDELADYFRASADAKREELRREADRE